jgi:capsular polysaccharide biosynthesis protein
MIVRQHQQLMHATALIDKFERYIHSQNIIEKIAEKLHLDEK